ncbi:unnamed protein product [Adineta steineri]|uniref:Chitin-binding type-1 domain-containing protein n=1 Tax=Adineta steineri TaxID=433720 RepID=A0A815RZA0_9BILA|nr:unnamed protein product [Adineta steineri]CAF1485036.1 unnamed protein product [Adineta steineri]
MVSHKIPFCLLFTLLLNSFGLCRQTSDYLAVAPRAVCPESNMCLSQWGYCGVGNEYCGENCQGGPCSGGGSGGGGSSTIFHGEGTHYDVAVGYTACGTLHSRFDMVAALNAHQFDPHTPYGNPNKNSLCGKRMRVQGPSGTVDVAIVDRCPGCKTGDIDLNEAAFAKIGSTAAGRIRISWHWL